MKPFTDTLNSLRFGSLSDELSDKLQALLLECVATHKGGSLTLKLKLKPGNAGQIEITDDIVVTSPKYERGTSIMFATPEGNLQREDPRQQSLPGLKSVELGEKQELKKVGA
jgi:hypothetical protein